MIVNFTERMRQSLGIATLGYRAIGVEAQNSFAFTSDTFIENTVASRGRRKSIQRRSVDQCKDFIAHAETRSTSLVVSASTFSRASVFWQTRLF